MKSFLTDFVFFSRFLYIYIYIYIYYWITKCAVWATHPPTHPPTHHPPTLPLFRGWVRFSLTQNSSIQAQAPIYIYFFFLYLFFPEMLCNGLSTQQKKHKCAITTRKLQRRTLTHAHGCNEKNKAHGSNACPEGMGHGPCLGFHKKSRYPMLVC